MPADQSEWYSENRDSGMLKTVLTTMDKLMLRMDRVVELLMRVLGLSDVMQGGTRAAGAALATLCSGR